MKWFEITPQNEGMVKLDEKTFKGELTFKVTNVSGKALRARAAVIPQEGEQKDWMSIKGKDIRPMAEYGEEPFTVGIAAPEDAKPGTYSTTFVVCNEANPEEEMAEVQARFEVPKPILINGRKRPVWPWIAAGAAALVVIGIVAAVLVHFIIPPRLVADFTWGNPSGTAPLTVSFRDQSQGNPKSWEWTFGTGETRTERDPDFTFNTPGTYGVTLKVTRGRKEDTKVVPPFITVTPAPMRPVARFSAQVLASGPSRVAPTPPTGSRGKISPPPSGNATRSMTDLEFRFRRRPDLIFRPPIQVTTKQTVQFIDVSDGDIKSRSWNFGDNTPVSTDQHPQHRYNRAGTFTVSLTVTGPGGSAEEKKPGFVKVTQAR